MAKIDWSFLPTDALDAISKLLTFDPDYIRFRSVCRSWRSAAPRRRPQLPWLIGHRKDADGNHTLFTFFRFSPAGDGIIPIAELPESSLFGGMPCRGSSHGWMALLDFAAPSIVLFNPLTGSKIQLPNLTESDRREYSHWGFRETEFYLANKVILSSDPAASSDYVAFIVRYRGGPLAFCRAGDSRWTPVNCPPLPGYTVDAVFYKGRFYVVAYGNVYVCDIGPDNASIKLIASVSLECTRLVEIDESHLVESDGDLLLVLGGYPDPYRSPGSEFEVFRVESGEQVKSVKMKSLGGRALFLGRNHSFSIPADQVPGCKGDCIYYTQISSTLEERFIAKSFGVFDLKNGSNVVIPDDAAHPHPNWKPCIWFTPNLLPSTLGTREQRQ